MTLARITAVLASIALALGLAAAPVAAEQTAAPQCYDVVDCKRVIKRLTTEGDNLRSDVQRLQIGVDQANAHIRVLNDNIAGRDREIVQLRTDLDYRTVQRDAAEARVEALLAQHDDLSATSARLETRNARLVERNARLKAVIARLRDR